MKSNKFVWLFVILLGCISAIAYLPLVSKFGYTNDDWYLMYDAHTQGAQFFHEIFRGDRPGRAFLMIPLFSLFGSTPLYYNLTAFLFRFLGGASLFLTLRMLWPQKHFFAVTTAILFTIYPGFLSEPNAIDYQSHILALFLALLSVALTVKSIVATDRSTRVFMILASILTGWAYLSQMEYFIGIEAFRFACVSMLLWRSGAEPLRKKAVDVLWKYLPFVAVPAGFLLWRLFFFQTDRRATDVEFQMGQLFSSPLTGLWWLAYLIQDAFNVLLVAWGLPLYLITFQLRLREMFIGLGLAIFAVVLLIILMRWMEKNQPETEEGPDKTNPLREQLWVGLLGVFGGLVPVILANRHVVFPDYSRYTLVASAGAVILLTALIERLSTRILRIAAAAFFVAVAVLTHYGNSVQAATDMQAVQDFWWQVAWRAPEIKPGTTLVANYPVGAIPEDYFVWGPANLIYYPEKQNKIPITIQLPAAVLTDDVVLQILMGKGEETPLRRGNELTRDFGNVLVMTQASEAACVRLVDGKSPDLSIGDPQKILLIASSSKLDNVGGEGHAMPPVSIFGSEPEHDWCFYYQKADLARQQGDWKKVAQLGTQVEKLGLHPNDQIEWMPFLQAYAALDNLKEVKGISTRINTQLFYKQQACDRLNSMAQLGDPLSAEMQSEVDELFCQ